MKKILVFILCLTFLFLSAYGKKLPADWENIRDSLIGTWTGKNYKKGKLRNEVTKFILSIDGTGEESGMSHIKNKGWTEKFFWTIVLIKEKKRKKRGYIGFLYTAKTKRALKHMGDLGSLYEIYKIINVNILEHRLGWRGGKLWMVLNKIKSEEKEPKKISLGMTIEEVEKILGKPKNIFELGGKVIYKYNDVKITFKDGKLINIE